jgi:uncharacterized protein YecE (DUF72 family)
MSAEERLRYYADNFDLVEVDATYYFPPSEDLAGLWARRTPDDFRMDIKAFGLLTQHPAKRDAVWEDVAEQIPAEHAAKRSVYLSQLPDAAVDLAFEHFDRALRPLHSAGKLGAILFQFPKWFTNRRDNRRFLDSLKDRLPEYDKAVEFRHASWLSDDSAPKTLKQLENQGLAFVCVDEPQGFTSSVPPVLAATSDLAVIRFHGHNRENWEAKGISPAERFRYLYSDDELEQWAPRVAELSSSAGETHALFNNCYQDYGVRNARQLADLLDATVSGATSPAGPALSESSRDELYEMARQRDIAGRSTMTKDELRAALE